MNEMWPVTLLGEVLIERKETPNPIDIQTGEIRIISKISFNTGSIDFRLGKQTRTKMILIQPGDLVVSGINAAKGAIAIYPKREFSPVAATIHYCAYRVNEEKADMRFFWWLLRSNTFRNVLASKLPGGIKTELKAKRLLAISLPLPRLSDQQLIVAKIEKFNEKIQKAKDLKKITDLESTQLMESSINAIMEPLERNGVFGDVITFKPRSGPSFVTGTETGGFPILMPSSVTGFGVNPLKVEYSLHPVEVVEKDVLQPGDILIARGNKREQVGNAGIVPKECQGWACANLLMRIQIDPNKVNHEFCIYWLRSPFMRGYVKTKISGTNPNIQKINQKKVLNFPFPTTTSISMQRYIVSKLDALQMKVDYLKSLQSQTQNEIDALLPSVLDKAFKGEL